MLLIVLMGVLIIVTDRLIDQKDQSEKLEFISDMINKSYNRFLYYLIF